MPGHGGARDKVKEASLEMKRRSTFELEQLLKPKSSQFGMFTAGELATHEQERKQLQDGPDGCR